MKEIVELAIENWFATIAILGVVGWLIINVIRAIRGQNPTDTGL